MGVVWRTLVLEATFAKGWKSGSCGANSRSGLSPPACRRRAAKPSRMPWSVGSTGAGGGGGGGEVMGERSDRSSTVTRGLLRAAVRAGEAVGVSTVTAGRASEPGGRCISSSIRSAHSSIVSS